MSDGASDGVRRISRRALLTRAARLAAAAGTAGVARWVATAPRFAIGEVPADASFVEPPAVASAAGLLEVTLRAAPVDLPWAGGVRWALAYNGTVPGPTLRVRPGDRLVVHLENGLDQPTNLHVHGMHVPPSVDDVFVRVAPGETRTYVYDLPPDHPAGLFWYHPHVHPWLAAHISAGLAGLIVVDDAEPLPAALADATERCWVLADPAIGAGPEVLDATHDERMAGREGEVVLVNGVPSPTLEVAAGTLERWRILNASASRCYRLALEGHRLVRVGGDQGWLPAPERLREVLVVPGERVDLLVAPRRAGQYRLRALAYDRGGPSDRGGPAGGGRVTVATMRVRGDAVPPALPRALPGRVGPVPKADRTRIVDLGMAMVAVDDHAGHETAQLGDVFTINGRTFDPDRVDVTVPLGTTQEWVIRNATTMDHPIHLHSWPFRVVACSDRVPVDPGWKDTVNVPAGVEVRVRIPFDRYPGRSVYHCHVLDHGDLGMMATIHVR